MKEPLKGQEPFISFENSSKGLLVIFSKFTSYSDKCTSFSECMYCSMPLLMQHKISSVTFPIFPATFNLFDNLAKVAIHCYIPSLWTFVFEPKTMKSSDPVSLHVHWNFVYCQASCWFNSSCQMYLYNSRKVSAGSQSPQSASELSYQNVLSAL